MKKFFKWFFLGMLGLVLVLGIGGFLFLTLNPQFGGRATDEQREQYVATGHFSEGIFLNYEEIHMEMDCHSLEQMIAEMFRPDPRVAPSENIKVISTDPVPLCEQQDSSVKLVWLGHSSFLVQMEGKTILLDPVFGKYASPHPWLGRERFNQEMPFEIAELPEVDAVIISHDHYDHLDYPSIRELKDKTNHFFVPLGVGNHLRRWEIEEERIHEMDWWEEGDLEGLNIAFTPSRHMSGRGISDQSATLWGSWVLEGDYKKVYFSGDGGYGQHFKEIGQRYGPFDLGLMECGQYNKLWADVHMMPEQTVQAAIDVKAEMMIPIHWGAFVLATHSWTDPIERATAEARRLKVPLRSPRIGEVVTVGDSIWPRDEWWAEID